MIDTVEPICYSSVTFVSVGWKKTASVHNFFPHEELVRLETAARIASLSEEQKGWLRIGESHWGCRE